MTLDDLKIEYDKLQLKYGDKELDSIYNGGCIDNPDICFVFMNPTKRNVASNKSWKGLKSPWIGTKNIWDLFYKTNLLDEDIYKQIRNITGPEWTEEFASDVYENEELKNKELKFISKYITNWVDYIEDGHEFDSSLKDSFDFKKMNAENIIL